jgi:hypothetical protein
MIINSTPENTALLSNAGPITNFAIKSTARSFQILSSGLYANKIRAIIRELSCNAIDSHVAAGRADTPFEVHLPNHLEPWFSIRDHGVGLTHEQVLNVYTTYFESTKTESNDFIGALGLGSKSPFSYTENFTVTAVKNGIKGIYTAFINEQGVPSIAQMCSEVTDESPGVEVKFSVNSGDFGKFYEEALHVYRWFQLVPTVTGQSLFARRFADQAVKYVERDLIQGVHAADHRSLGSVSYAVMGNIAYPINVPNEAENLGHLSYLLKCNLVMHFGIGELDFQASREGLSYDANTISNIRARLDQLNAVIYDRLVERISPVQNVWERFWLLRSLNETELWSSAIATYGKSFPHAAYLIRNSYGTVVEFSVLKITEAQLAEWNIKLSGFHSSYSYKSCKDIKPQYEWDINKSAYCATWWKFHLTKDIMFVENDIKVSAVQRAKYHVQTRRVNHLSTYVLEPQDRTKTMNLDAFYAAIHNPPTHLIVQASQLEQKPKVARSQHTEQILLLAKRDSGSYAERREMVWQPAGNLSDFDTDTVFYFVPMKGYELISQHSVTDVKQLHTLMQGSGLFSNIRVYGVRKSQIGKVETMPNWINLETYLVDALKNVDIKIASSLLPTTIPHYDELCFDVRVAPKLDQSSPYRLLSDQLKDTVSKSVDYSHLNNLFRLFQIPNNLDNQLNQLKQQAEQVLNRYPLLRHLRSSHAREAAILEYINLIDQARK